MERDQTVPVSTRRDEMGPNGMVETGEALAPRSPPSEADPSRPQPVGGLRTCLAIRGRVKPSKDSSPVPPHPVSSLFGPRRAGRHRRDDSAVTFVPVFRRGAARRSRDRTARRPRPTDGPSATRPATPRCRAILTGAAPTRRKTPLTLEWLTTALRPTLPPNAGISMVDTGRRGWAASGDRRRPRGSRCTHAQA
jgi:hypothetical protein